MATATKVDLDAKLAELQDAVEKARKAKKGTKVLLAQVAELEVQIAAETVEAPKAKRGRPRTKSDAYYELKAQFKRTGRGRPKRSQVEADLRTLGVEGPLHRLSVREVEQMFARVLAEKLEDVA